MKDTLVCWNCGASIAELPLPLVRLAECPACHAALHVCLLCRFYDPGVSQSCREPIAEEVSDKKHANFCGYFQARPDAYRPRDRAAQHRAQADLEALFGGAAKPNDAQPDSDAGAQSEAEAANQCLQDLFKK